MGYRSNVVIAISKENFLEAMLKGNLPEVFTDKHTDTHIDDDMGYYFSISSVKWYDDYPYVREVSKFLEALEEGTWGLMRTGEESGDIEEMGEPYNFDIYTSTYIDYPGSEL